MFCPPRERLAGRRVAAEGARKKMIYRGGHPFLVETEKSRVGLEAGRRHRLLAFLFFFNFKKKSILDHFFFPLACKFDRDYPFLRLVGV